MIGHCIGSGISVDLAYSHEKCVYFLTHIDQDISMKISLLDNIDCIYTSEINVWILENHFKVDPQRLASLPTGRTFNFKNYETGVEFRVTAFDVYDKSGSVMFFFQGNEFGNVLYIGRGFSNCEALYQDNLSNILNEQVIDIMYVDTSALKQTHNFPDLKTALMNVISFLKCYENYRIIFILEDMMCIFILLEIRAHLKELIYVSRKTFEFLQIIQESEGFTTNYLDAKKYAISYDEVEDFLLYETSSDSEIPRTNILLASSSLIHSVLDNHLLELSEMHIYCYRNYISKEELQMLFQQFQPKDVVSLQEPNLLLRSGQLNSNHSNQNSKGSDVKKISYWEHISESVAIFYQNPSLKKNHIMTRSNSKPNRRKIKSLKVTSSSSSNVKLNNNSVGKIRQCSVLIKKLTSEEIQKHCNKRIGTPNVDNRLQEKPSDSRCSDKALSEIQLQSNKLTSNGHNNCECSRSSTVTKELKVQLVDIIKTNEFFNQLGLKPVWKSQNIRNEITKQQLKTS